MIRELRNVNALSGRTNNGTTLRQRNLSNSNYRGLAQRIDRQQLLWSQALWSAFILCYLVWDAKFFLYDGNGEILKKHSEEFDEYPLVTKGCVENVNR